MRDSSRTALANPTATEKLGLNPAKLDELFGTTNAPDGASPTSVGMASRYHDLSREGVRGSVRGDGRAVEVARVLKTDDTGRVTGVSSVQQKGGVDTGLAPVGLVKGVDGHTGGTHPLDFALKDAITASYLEANGVRAERWVAVQRLAPWLARYVREGEFVRLAHLNYLRDDPTALRGVFDQVNKQLSVELGRSRQMTMPGLYKTLVQRKAQDLADLFWARMSHDSITYDNVGLLSTLDLTVMSAQDRFHSTPVSHVATGYAKEPKRVLVDLFAPELRNFMLLASTPAERAVLAKVPFNRLAQGTLDYAMTGRMLGHLGFDAHDVMHAMKSQTQQSMKAFRTLFEVGTQVETGSRYTIGNVTRTDAPRYDAFGALKELVAISSSNHGLEEKKVALAAALRPINPDAARDLEVAEQLLNAFEPIIAAATTGLHGPALAAKRELIIDQARRINAPLEALEYDNAMKVGTTVGQYIENHQDAAAAVVLQRLVRLNVRKGPSSAHGVAMALRRQELKPNEDGWLTLSSDVEQGVRIEEQSNGEADRVRITLTGNPAQLRDPSRYLLNIGFRADNWKLGVKPSAKVGDALVFDVPVRPGESVDSLLYGFVSSDKSGHLDTADGGLFGQGIQPVLSSKLLQAELAHYAHAHGRARPDAEALRKAVAGAPRSGGAESTVPKVLERLKTIDDLYNLDLPRPKTPTDIGLFERLKGLFGR